MSAEWWGLIIFAVVFYTFVAIALYLQNRRPDKRKRKNMTEKQENPENVVKRELERWQKGDESDLPVEDRYFGQTHAVVDVRSLPDFERDLAIQLEAYTIERAELEDAAAREIAELAQLYDAKLQRHRVRLDTVYYAIPRITWRDIWLSLWSF